VLRYALADLHANGDRDASVYWVKSGYEVMASLRKLVLGISVLGTPWPMATYADQTGDWYARLGALEALYDSSARIYAPNGIVPGASAKVSNSTTAILDLGYDLTSRAFATLMVGVPPRPRIDGRGTASGFGQLGAVTYGPAVLTAGYRIPAGAWVQPYVAAGAAYAIILRNHDAAIADLKVHNHFGFALNAGVEIPMGDRWRFFVDAKKLWLSVDANGLLDDALPVAAKVQLNPTLISIGVKFQFRKGSAP
jgi:outer membrane protein